MNIFRPLQTFFDIALTMVLSPVFILQGFYVKKIALRLPEPKGLRFGQVGKGPHLRLLILGDSAAAGVGAQTQEEALSGCVNQKLASKFDVNWRLIARSGATTISTLSHLKNIDAQRYDAVVLSLGVNDVTSGMSVRKWQKYQRALLDFLFDKFRAQSIFVSAVPPMAEFPLLPQPLRWYLGRRAQLFDAISKEMLADYPKCVYVKCIALDKCHIAEDGFHPSPILYAT